MSGHQYKRTVRPRIGRGFRVAGVTAAVAAACAVPASAAVNLSLDFNASVPGTLTDSAGIGTGFTSVQPASFGVAYVPANLRVADGRLAIVSTAGDNKYDNNQQNALQVSFDGTQPYRASTTIESLGSASQPFQGGGLYVGPDEDNFVKLVANVGFNGPRIEMHMDRNGPAGLEVEVREPGLTAAKSIRLSLSVDPATGTVIGSYAIEGGPAGTVGPLILPGVGGPAATAGVLTTNLAAPSPVTLEFGDFRVQDETQPPSVAGPLCGPPVVPPAPTGSGSSKVTLSSKQLLINQRISQAALRRANGAQAWLDAGIRRDDLCGGALTERVFNPAMTLAEEPGPHALTTANPRPVTTTSASRSGGRAVSLTPRQLQINQRISQAAIRRLNALDVRLGRLTGGDIRDGEISRAKLRQSLAIRTAPGVASAARSRTVIAAPATKSAGRVTVSVVQFRINQRIAQAAVRRSNALIARLGQGLSDANFAPVSIGAPALDATVTIATP